MMHKQQAPWFWNGREYPTQRAMWVEIMTHFAREYYCGDEALTLSFATNDELVEDAIKAEVIDGGEWYQAILALDDLREVHNA